MGLSSLFNTGSMLSTIAQGVGQDKILTEAQMKASQEEAKLNVEESMQDMVNKVATHGAKLLDDAAVPQ